MWVRQTRELMIRISEHKSSIRNRDERSPVVRHCNSAGHRVCGFGSWVFYLLKRGDRERRLCSKDRPVGYTTYRLSIWGAFALLFSWIQMGIIDVHMYLYFLWRFCTWWVCICTDMQFLLAGCKSIGHLSDSGKNTTWYIPFHDSNIPTILSYRLVFDDAVLLITGMFLALGVTWL